MSKPWLSDARQRRSKRYAAIHAQLRLETERKRFGAITDLMRGEPSKTERRKTKHALWRQNGAP